MRKGEESKKKIIDAAEKLFGEKGYQSTSVQGVLDALGISKGGFYHYFETKMELLSAVCTRRATDWYEQGLAYVRALRAGPVEKLNAALKLVNTLDRQSPALLGAITELTLATQDASVRGALRAIALSMLAPLVEEIIDHGAREKQFTVKRAAESARIVTLLALDVNEEAAREIATRYESSDCALNVLELLTAYRDAVEAIVNAPHGSIELFDFGDMFTAVSRVVTNLKGTGRES